MPLPITTEYGAQKFDAERGILALGDRATVVRATKVVSCKVPLFADWLTRLGKQVEIQAFSEKKVFCPISLCFIVKCLAELVPRNVSGVFHLFGVGLVSYTDFALQFAASMNADYKLVVPTSIYDVGILRVGYPQHPCLDMKSTTAILGSTAQSVESVINNLLEEFAMEHTLRIEKLDC